MGMADLIDDLTLISLRVSSTEKKEEFKNLMLTWSSL